MPETQDDHALLNNMTYQLGNAYQHRQTMTAMYRHDQSEDRRYWMDGANRELRNIRSRIRTIEDRIWRNWNKTPQ